MKKQLRKQIVSARPHSSLGISERLIEYLQGGRFQEIASYKPLASEPDISEFNSWADHNLEKVWFPVIAGSDLHWGYEKFQRGNFGLMQPTATTTELTAQLVIVPALAVDRFGNRLGKGQGFYDRALEKFKGKVLAVVFAEELLDSIPAEPHDRKVDLVITPKELVTF